MYFGCQWTYAFHRKSEKLLTQNEILSGFGEGFRVLVNYQTGMDEKNTYKISLNVDINPYNVEMNSKVRIDKPDGGHVWYIFNPALKILREQKTLKNGQYKLPIASGISCKDVIQLINKQWRPEQIVEEEGQGQFPI